MDANDRVTSKSETYSMSEDGSISMDFIDGANGVRGETHVRVKTGDPLHTELLKRFPDLKPGDDWITIHSDFINGEWVEVPAPPPSYIDPNDFL